MFLIFSRGQFYRVKEPIISSLESNQKRHCGESEDVDDHHDQFDTHVISYQAVKVYSDVMGIEQEYSIFAQIKSKE